METRSLDPHFQTVVDLADSLEGQKAKDLNRMRLDMNNIHRHMRALNDHARRLLQLAADGEDVPLDEVKEIVAELQRIHEQIAAKYPEYADELNQDYLYDLFPGIDQDESVEAGVASADSLKALSNDIQNFTGRLRDRIDFIKVDMTQLMQEHLLLSEMLAKAGEMVARREEGARRQAVVR